MVRNFARLPLFALVLLAALPAAGEEKREEPSKIAGETSGMVGEIRPLKFEVLDLKFDVQPIKGATQDLAMKETELEIKIELPGDILFDFDKSDIRHDAEPTLEKVAEQIRKYPKGHILIEGYTDSKGADDYNLKLSDRRSKSVKDWLVKADAKGRGIKTKGWGEANPVAPNENTDGSDNPEGRQKNRRVEITIKKR
jgi:outer membrane protein OmpA-like peptidoglycan-associated protein